MGNSIVGRSIPLGTQWVTADPFLFCAHHLDYYPAADGALGPAASLDGRQIGQDFAGVEGWNMYHGSTVPGFPQHPHRGFETVTYVRRGWCDHSDSLGARARFGEGDVQWLTAGKGIVHSEMFPLFDAGGPNTLHLFQLWLNLPSSNKMVDPYFSMLWSEQVPITTPGPGVEVTVIAGDFGGVRAAAPPPDSWASGDNGVEIWHVRLEPGAEASLPAAATGANRMLYLFDGGDIEVGGDLLAQNHGAVVEATHTLEVAAPTGAELMVLSGRPIGEPVAQYGPFVMNDRVGIEQAFRDYQATGFGGWPWSSDDPVHGAEAQRFASLPDGSLVQP